MIFQTSDLKKFTQLGIMIFTLDIFIGLQNKSRPAWYSFYESGPTWYVSKSRNPKLYRSETKITVCFDQVFSYNSLK